MANRVTKSSIEAAPKPKAQDKVLPVKSAAPPTPNTTNDPENANEAVTLGNDPILAAAFGGQMAPPPTPTQETRIIDNDPLSRPHHRREALDDEVDEDEEMVDVVIPNDFVLIPEHGKRHEYKAGVQEMPKSHAEHWYSKAHGVKTKAAK